MSEQVFVNNAEDTIDSVIINGLVTTLESAGMAALLSGKINFPYEYTLLTLTEISAESSWEIVKCTNISGSTFTIERGQEGTTAKAWASGSKLSARLTQGSMQRARNQVKRVLFDGSGQILFDVGGEILLGPEE